PVMMPESFYFNHSMSDPTLNDPVAAANVGVIGGHLYGGTISDYPLAHNQDIPTWMTEYLVNDQTIDAAIDTAQQIHDCLTTGNMSAYVWWKCIGDVNGLISSNGVPQKRGFVLAQFSRFVRPGFNRIAATNNGSVLVTAYRNTRSTTFAIVAINWTDIPLTPVFNLRNFPGVASVTPWLTSPDASLAVQPGVSVTNGTFSYTLPGLSVATFVGNGNFPPTLAAIPDQNVDAGVTLLLTNTATDADLPAETLTFSLLTGPTNVSLAPLNPTNALFRWRPSVSQAGTTNLIAVTVSDNGSPALSATNRFTVTVNPLSSLPVIGASGPANGSILNLTIAGPTGPDYTLQTSTNLFDWQSLVTSNSPALPFIWSLTNSGDPSRFYRIQIGP
ncbi:MAG TPA: hypothetical protein VFV81_01500, partial [Verrucomicrobiae bacterium]|nr:hypothetical protein [Verrucomicrobiae bacterium]